ncbi:MAG: HlyD family efflux transporter periplasmic adaptor subunit [Patescibacteria group bacterium]
MIQSNHTHWFVRHTFITVFGILVLVGGAFFLYGIFSKNKEPAHYSLSLLKRGTIISSVTGSGHVSASNQFDVKSMVSGTIISIDVSNGKHVQEGAVLVRLDNKDAAKVVRDAQVSLQSSELALKKIKQPPDRLAVLQAENALTQSKNAKQRAAEDLDSARIALQKMIQPPDELALLQANNALISAQESLLKTKDDLKKSREDGFNAVADAFLNFPTIMTGLNDMFFVSSIDRNQLNVDWYANQITRWDSDKVIRYKQDLVTGYAAAKKEYDTNFDHYKTSSRSSDPQTLEALIIETYETSKLISDTVKAANNFVDLIQNALKEHSYPLPSVMATHKNTLTTYTSQSNISSSNLLAIKQDIESKKTSIISAQRTIDDKTESLRKLKEGADPLDIQAQKITIKQREDAIFDADRAIVEKTESLRKLKEGADPLDIQAQELTVIQRKNTLVDAQEKLGDYTIRAPFSGDIAALPVKTNDSLSPSSIAITLITSQSIVELSLNEVDVAKVKRSQKVTLTFDALPDVAISGSISDIDTVGTVSQGVVTYIVKVSLDIQDERVKPGMSASGTIIIDIRQDVLVAPNSALKSRGDASYILVPSESVPPDRSQLNNIILASEPREALVITGGANDTLTEIISGLKEGDMIIVKTIQQQSQPVQSQAPSIFGSPGGSRGFGGGSSGAAGRLGR